VKCFLLSIFVLSTCLNNVSATELTGELDQRALWTSGTDGYHTYRIPAIVVSTNGTVLAFSEGRKNSRSDSGDVNLLLKRSTDGGKTWSRQKLLWNDSDNTCGNPCPLVDQTTGTVWLLLTWNNGSDTEHEIIRGRGNLETRRVFVMSSNDDGLSWSKPEDITSDVKQADWTWYATGPGSGIQLNTGKHAGRLVAACDHVTANAKAKYSHIIYSDDHGKYWQLGGVTPKPEVNECEVVELSDGRLLLNMRNYAPSSKTRQIAFSPDGGLSWRDQGFDNALIEPICQASLQRFSWPKGDDNNIILFSNPANTTARVKMTVRASYDNCATWPKQLVLHNGPSAYSDLAVLPDGTILCLYERGSKHPYETITLARFSLDSLKGAPEK
jgi:sialidase-1